MRALMIAAAISFLAVLSLVQPLHAEPYARVYFDRNYHQTLAPCQSQYQVGEMYVVLHDLDMWIWAVEFRVYIPPEAFYVFWEETPPSTLYLGSIENGISIAWTVPQQGDRPVLALTIHGVWLCTCDTFRDDPDNVKWIRIEPAFDSGNRGVVRFPDFAQVPIGYRPSVVGCPILSSQQTTWGAVKALYR